MGAFLHSRHWSHRLLRIGALSAALWWAVGHSGALAPVPDDWRAEWPRTDFSRTTVDLGEIIGGGPPKDGIPAIDRPRFESAARAANWLDDREPVIVVAAGGQARAYPLQILIYHEIVNDTLGGVPISVTFCPLCNASIVFDRRVAGTVLDFGTTGRLRKSDLVMYDRQSESWWQQFSGEGIVGHYAGSRLVTVPSQLVAFATFRRAHPDGEVLSRRTGHRRPYGTNPYRGYDRVGDRPFLFTDPVDPRLPAMERVLAVRHAGRQRLYPFSELRGAGVVLDEIGGTPIAVFHRRDQRSVLDRAKIADSRIIQSAAAYYRLLEGRRLDFEIRDDRIVDRQTGSQWDLLGRAVAGPLRGRQLAPVDSGVHFAFAWLAFNPDSEIYRAGTAGDR